MFKIKVDKEKCVGCGSCASVCDKFEIEDDGKAHAKVSEVKDESCVKEAQEICPVHAISVKKKEDKL